MGKETTFCSILTTGNLVEIMFKSPNNNILITWTLESVFNLGVN